MDPDVLANLLGQMKQINEQMQAMNARVDTLESRRSTHGKMPPAVARPQHHYNQPTPTKPPNKPLPRNTPSQTTPNTSQNNGHHHQWIGHLARQCPPKGLSSLIIKENPIHQKETKPKETMEVEVYEADPTWAEEYIEQEQTLEITPSNPEEPTYTLQKEENKLPLILPPPSKALTQNHLGLFPINQPKPKLKPIQGTPAYTVNILIQPPLPRSLGHRDEINNPFNVVIMTQPSLPQSLGYRDEFAYNHSVHMSLRMNLIETEHGCKPRKFPNLILLLMPTCVSESAQSFAQHVRNLHKNIMEHIKQNNQTYKLQADTHRRHQDLKEGDLVMVRTERLIPGVSSKLKARGAGPFKILRQIGSNAYVDDIPLDYGVSPTFNVADLVPFKGQAAIPSDPFEPTSPFIESEPLLEIPPAKRRGQRESIERILDEQITTTRNRVYHRYHVRWKKRPWTEGSWINKEELQPP